MTLTSGGRKDENDAPKTLGAERRTILAYKRTIKSETKNDSGRPKERIA